MFWCSCRTYGWAAYSRSGLCYNILVWAISLDILMLLICVVALGHHWKPTVLNQSVLQLSSKKQQTTNLSESPVDFIMGRVIILSLHLNHHSSSTMIAAFPCSILCGRTQQGARASTAEMSWAPKKAMWTPPGLIITAWACVFVFMNKRGWECL